MIKTSPTWRLVPLANIRYACGVFLRTCIHPIKHTSGTDLQQCTDEEADALDSATTHRAGVVLIISGLSKSRKFMAAWLD